jgi:hypothetical protein
MIERKVEADVVECAADAMPDLLTRNPEVLASERDIVADPGEDHLRIGILQDEPRPAPRLGGGPAVDEEGAGLLALLGTAVHPRQSVQQCRLAGPRGAHEQYPFPLADAQIDPIERPALPAGVPPSPPACLDADGGGDGGCRHHRQTRCETSCPAANRLSAPVAASARTMTHPSRPASRAPETTTAVK